MVNVLNKICLFLCLIYLSNALYEDQVGKFDWKQSYVGRALFSKIDYDGKRVFVATENNVVASINLVDGSLIWRRVLEADKSGKINAFSVGNEVITVSGDGPYLLRGWNLKSGVLTYEWVLPSLGQSDILWAIDFNEVHQVRRLNNVVEVTSHHIKTGSPVGPTKSTSAPWLSSSECLLDDGTLLCVSSDGNLTTFSLSSSSMESFKLPSTPLPPFKLHHLPSEYISTLLVTPAGKQAIAINDGKVVTVDVPSSSRVTIMKSSSEPILIIAHNEVGGYYISWEGLSSKKELKENYLLIHDQKLADGVISSSYCFTESFRLHCQLLIVGDDDSLILIDGDNVLWVREEALANIITVEMIDLPVSDEEAAIEKEFANKEGGIIGMFYRRVHSQCLQVINFATSVLGLKENKGESRNDLVKDQFGLHKLMILVTKSSKVYGMENEKGDIVWQFHLKDLEPFQILGDSSVPFFIQRTSRHLPYPAICTIIFKQKVTGLSSLYVFSPISGQPLYGGVINLDFRIKQSLLLPTENNEFIKGLIFLSDSDEVHHFPESTKDVALELHKSLYMFTVQPETGLLEGYTFLSSDGQDLKVLKAWNLQLSPPIIRVGIKNKAERVHSQGRVLGDRSVLYKYINPHLIAVATHTPDPVHKNLVSVFLIDTVSGAVVFSVVHKRATPPVHVVHSENWVVYTFFNDKSRRTEVISLDLYEGKSQRNSTDFTSLSFQMDPLIDRQAYIFPHNILSMRETITEKGITNKHVLVAVSTGSVIEVPWALLDPHRSPDGREEGVLPYTPDLSLPPEAILTYNHTLPLIYGIHTSPSGLESTSLVLIYGLDLFYTRVAPSKTFDVLKDDFEYWLITLVLGGLITAAYISKKLASRKALRQAWK